MLVRKKMNSIGHVPRIGILSPGTEPGMRHWWKELRLGLNDLGYVEGSNVELIWRFADGRFERLPELAAEFAKLEVDIVMPATPHAIRAAKSACGNIPIVFPLGSDPVETGLVANLERPGGNATGMGTMSWRQCRPRLGFVSDIIPSARRVASICHSANAPLQLQVEAYRAAAGDFDLEFVALDFSTAEEIENTFKIATENEADAVLPLSDPLAFDNAKTIGKLSMQWRIPVISPFQEITEAGGVLGYGPDLSTLFRRSAGIVDQIIKGANPGDIPIGEPQKFDLSINLKSSRALGLAVPDSLFSRATYLVR
jgi:putative tryptophan/tyrosine transport system substrate-binding protein